MKANPTARIVARCLLTWLLASGAALAQPVPDWAGPETPSRSAPPAAQQPPGLPPDPDPVPLGAGVVLLLAAAAYGALRLRMRLVPVAAGVLLLATAPVYGQGEPGGEIPISEILREDGTLDLTRGASGTIDLTGFQMDTGPEGQPVFLPDAGRSDEGTWAGGFHLSGADGIVRAIAIGSDGSLYVAGDFTIVEDVPANRAARWDGARWHSLGTGSANGLSGTVRALAVSGSDLYVGGLFMQAGGSTANNVARWDGAQWYSLGTGGTNGVNSIVQALAVSNSVLYLGGQFTQAGGQTANRVARWDGAQWHSLGEDGANGLNHWVQSLAVSGSDLYVGGNFTEAGGQTAHRVARWDGWQWHSLGSESANGVNNFVTALVVSGSDLYVGGDFTLAGGQTSSRVARWDQEEWHSLGTGSGNGVNSTVFALAVSGSDLFVGGQFTQAGGQTANRVARWDGTGWQRVAAGSANGVDAWVQAFAVNGSDLYVGGAFTHAGDQQARNVARWDGAGWHSLGTGSANGVSSTVLALAVSGSDLYVGGQFQLAGGQFANRVARWDGEQWHSLGTGSANGVNGAVHALVVSGSDLYVGGTFTLAGGQTANRVARWDGATWHSLGTGITGSGGISVNALAVSSSHLYVGGAFTQAGSAMANNVARWDGAQWRGLGAGPAFGVNGSVAALAVSGSGLYVGGGFTQAGGQFANRVARWDGTTWHSLGSGVTGLGGVIIVSALAVSSSDLYVGGLFTQAGIELANRVARWDGAAWHGLASGVNDRVLALSVSGSDLYMGGQFTFAGGLPSSRIALWLPAEAFTGCTAASSGAWSAPGTWNGCDGGTPGANEDVRIAPAQTVTLDEPAAVARLVIDGTLVAEDALTVFEHLKLSGGLTIDGGSVLLASGPGGSRENGVTIATFEDAGGSLTGELDYERYYAHEERGWRMIGSPFAGVPFTSLNDDFHTQGALNADFEDGAPILFRFDAEAGAWEAVADYEETASPGAGYLFYMFEGFGETQHLPGRWRIEGLQNAEPTAPALFYDGEDPTFNLVANPFAGPLDWHAVHGATSGVGATYYVWETLGFEPGVGSTGVYRSYHTSELGDAGRHIAPFQAFWVYAEAAMPSIVFDYAMKDFEASPVIVGRPGQDAPLAAGGGSGFSALTLALEGEGLVASRPTALFHSSDASLDSPYLWPLAAEYAAAYFSDQAGRALLYAGASQPGAEDTALALHFEATRAGNYTVTWPDWHAVPEHWQLALVDHDTGAEVDLREASSYTFSHTPRSVAAPGEALVPGAVRRSTGQARFALVARTGPVSTDGDGSLPTVFAFESAFPNPLAGRATLRLAVPQTAEVTVTAYDLLGRVVARVLDEELVPGIHEVPWDASGLAAGLYLLRMSSGTFTQTRRLTLVH